jgi:hypothetical protein
MPEADRMKLTETDIHVVSITDILLLPFPIISAIGHTETSGQKD